MTHLNFCLIIVESDENMHQFKKDIAKELDIENLGHADSFPEVQIFRKDEAIYFCQDRCSCEIMYILKVKY